MLERHRTRVHGGAAAPSSSRASAPNQQFVFTVRDYGAWRPLIVNPERNRGLDLIGEVTDEVRYRACPRRSAPGSRCAGRTGLHLDVSPRAYDGRSPAFAVPHRPPRSSPATSRSRSDRASCSTRVSLTVPPGADRHRRAERHRQEHAAADPRRASTARPRHRHALPPVGDRRLPAPEPERRAGETLRAFLGRRTGVADARRRRSTPRPRRSPPAWPAPTTRTRTRSTATSRSAPPTSTRAAAAVVAPRRTPGRPPRPADARDVGRPGGARVARRDPAPRFDVFLLDEPTNDLDFAGLDLLERSSPSSPAARWSCRTTERSSIGRSTACSSSTSTRTRRTFYAGGWARVPRRARDGAAARARRSTRRTRRSAARSRPRRSSSASGRCRACSKVEEERREGQVHPALPHAVERAPGRQGADDRPGARAARGRRGREAVGRVGAAHGGRGRAAQRRHRRPPRRRDRAARRVRARADRPRDRLRRARRDPRRERQRQDDASAHAPRRLPLDVGDAAPRAVRRRRPSSTRRATASPATAICSTRSNARPVRDMSASPLDAREVRPRRRTRAAAGAHPLARRAHPRRRSRCSRPGRQLPRARRADEPPRPRPRSSSSNRPSTRSPARCSSSRTIARCSTRSSHSRTAARTWPNRRGSGHSDRPVSWRGAADRRTLG